MKNLYFRTFLILIYRKHYLVISKIKNVEKHLTITNKRFILYAIILGMLIGPIVLIILKDIFSTFIDKGVMRSIFSR